MDELSRKFRSIDWKGLQKSARRVQASTASALKDMVMTDLENKTRAATADTSWGASGADLMAIAHGTYKREDYALIMSIVWQRLASSRRRCVYKALDLLKFLIMHGAARCTEEARSALPHLRALSGYVATDEHGRDVGDGVRRRAGLICEMLSDESVLEAERAHSRELRAKLQGGADAPGGRLGGLSSADYRYGVGASTSQSAGYGSSDGADPSSADWNSSHMRTTATTATFKGYGEDDDADSGAGGNNSSSNGYDEEPNGEFAKRAKAVAAADDLLGGGPLAIIEGAKRDDEVTSKRDNTLDDDDDDFNPRALTSAKMSGTDDINGGVNDLLADLDNLHVNDNNRVVSQGSGQTQGLSTSQLVLQLAAQREQNGLQLAVLPNEPRTHGNDMNNGDLDSEGLFNNSVGTTGASTNGTNGSNLVGNGNVTPSSGNETGGPMKVLTRITEKEKDPFADLLSTGKQSGVL